MFGTTKEIIKQYEACIASQKEQYESRIFDLKSQIEDLRKLAFSHTSASNIPLAALEADAVMGQREETIELSEEELRRVEEIDSEASRILSGNY